MSNKMKNVARGFTAVELIITVAIAGILLAFAVPSFTYLNTKYRTINEISGFSGDLAFCRAEAIKEGQTVTMCASSDGVSCSGSASWQTGWIIYSNPNLTTTATAVLRRQPAWKSNDSFTADNSAAAITYTGDGFTRNLPGSGIVTFTLHTTPLNGALTQCVAINKAGRRVLQTAGTGNCS